MAAPDYVPTPVTEKPRVGERLPPAAPWKADRPAEVVRLARQPTGPKLGTPGPDQGYGLKLARRFEGKLVLASGEHAEDAVAGCLGVGLRRASLFGRAPVIYDFEHAFTLWGFLEGAPADLVEFRRPLFSGARHDYWDRREIVDRVPDDTLRLTPAQARATLSEWRSLLRTSHPPNVLH